MTVLALGCGPSAVRGSGHTDNVDPKLLNARAWALRWRDRVESTSLAEAARIASQRPDLEDMGEQGLALRTLTWQAKWRGELDLARRLGHGALPLLEATDRWAAAADVHSCLGVVHYSQGRRDVALAHVSAGFDLLQREPQDASRVDLLVTESTIMRQRGQCEIAIDRLDQAARLATRADLARVLSNMARHYMVQKDASAAVECALQGAMLARRWENRVTAPYTQEVLGAAHAQLGDMDRARECFDEGLEMARADGDLRAQCQLLHVLGSAELSQGRAEAAAALLESGLSFARQINYPLWQRNLLRTLADAQEQAGNLVSAMATMRELVRLRENERD